MVANVQFEIRGELDFKRRLAALTGKGQKNAVKAATRKAQGVVAKQARINAKSLDDPGTANKISKNVRVQFASRQSRGEKTVYRVGILGGARFQDRVGEIEGAGKGNPGGDTFYWRFLEFGTEHIPARAFMRPAQTGTMPEQFSTFTREFDTALDKILLKESGGQ